MNACTVKNCIFINSTICEREVTFSYGKVVICVTLRILVLYTCLKTGCFLWTCATSRWHPEQCPDNLSTLTNIQCHFQSCHARLKNLIHHSKNHDFHPKRYRMYALHVWSPNCSDWWLLQRPTLELRLVQFWPRSGSFQLKKELAVLINYFCIVTFLVTNLINGRLECGHGPKLGLYFRIVVRVLTASYLPYTPF